MKSCLPALVLLAACAAAPASGPKAGEPHRQRVSFYLGQRSLSEVAYAPVEDQPMFGVEYANEKEGSLAGWEVGLQGSGAEETMFGFDVSAQTGEVYAGVRKTFFDSTRTMRPYVGGGLSYITSRVEVDTVSEEDGSAAGYAHGGVLFDVTKAFFIGLDLRVLFGSEIEFTGFSGDADYVQGALVLGVSF